MKQTKKYGRNRNKCKYKFSEMFPQVAKARMRIVIINGFASKSLISIYIQNVVFISLLITLLQSKSNAENRLLEPEEFKIALTVTVRFRIASRSGVWFAANACMCYHRSFMFIKT